MNRKTIIQIIVITLCFVGSGLVLYNGLFKGSAPAPAPELALQNNQALTGAYGSEENPLPFGDNLSGELKKVLSRNGLQFGLFEYPKLNESEIGINVSDLVKPLPTPKN